MAPPLSAAASAKIQAAVASLDMDIALRALLNHIRGCRERSVTPAGGLVAPADHTVSDVYRRYGRLTRDLNELWESHFLLTAGAPILHKAIKSGTLRPQILPFMARASPKAMSKQDAYGALAKWSEHSGASLLVDSIVYMEGFVADLAYISMEAELVDTLTRAGPTTPVGQLSRALDLDRHRSELVSRQIDASITYASAPDTMFESDLIAPGVRAHFSHHFNTLVVDYKEANARRNLVVHGGGRVGHRYRRLVPTAALGRKVTFSDTYLVAVSTTLRQVAVCMTKGLVVAFGQPRARGRAELAYGSQHGRKTWP